MRDQHLDSDTPIFFLGVFSSVLGLIFILFIVLMVPYVFFNATATVPDVVVQVAHWLEARNDVHGFWQRAIILSPFVLASGLFFYISWYATRTIEKKDQALAPLHQSSSELKEDVSVERPPVVETKNRGDFDERHPALFIFSLILLIIFALILIEYLIGADLL